ncbi:MAG: asparagine synthase, partial [Symploca sp. SIO2B6]|nr:asparagine synthase [Symploca sp. SIO2B6]
MPSSTWCVGWKITEQIPKAVWQDKTIAIVGHSRSPVPFILSPSQRFVVVADIWLSRRPSGPGDRSSHHSTPAPIIPQSDLKWLATAWEHWGVETIPKLVGMFSLVVWDREERRLWMGRDPVGARSLYITTVGTSRWMAPNIRSLRPYHSHTLDPVALRDYLCCAFIPGHRTLWQEAQKVRPGTILSWPDGTTRAYWHLQETYPKTALDHSQNPTPQDFQSYRQPLRTMLDQVVQEALPSGDPVGVFLSGGLDSSCITALAAQFHPQPVHTFSIHFGPDCPNELEFSRLVAAHCHTTHHILEITFRQMWDELPETMAWLDSPIGDPLTVPNLLLGRLAKQSVGVILNGEGGDPCFGGPKNQPMLLSQLYGDRFSNGLNAQSESNAQPEQMTQTALQAYLLSFKKCAADLPQLLQPKVWEAVQDQPSVFADDLNSTASYLNRLMALNIKFKGADHILTKVDNLTQAAGLQGRSPLFDQRIVELSMQIPPEYKVAGVQDKAILKQAVADLLPNRILYRPKSGMMVPVQLGFKKYWQRQARALLLNRKAAIA